MRRAEIVLSRGGPHALACLDLNAHRSAVGMPQEQIETAVVHVLEDLPWGSSGLSGKGQEDGVFADLGEEFLHCLGDFLGRCHAGAPQLCRVGHYTGLRRCGEDYVNLFSR